MCFQTGELVMGASECCTNTANPVAPWGYICSNEASNNLQFRPSGKNCIQLGKYTENLAECCAGPFGVKYHAGYLCAPKK
jgi:hypothetical protein